MKALLLSVSAGAGHMAAAQAIKEYIDEHYPKDQAMVIDTLKYINPIVDKVIIGSYIGAVKVTPLIYKKLYEYAEKGEGILEATQKFNELMSSHILNLVRDFQPDIITTTHPFPMEMISTLKRKKLIDIPLLSVITDFTVHSMCVQSLVDGYVIANEDIRYDLLNKGIPENKIFPLGIPVHHNFTVQVDKPLIKKQLGLKDLPVILIMGGSLGMGQIKKIYQALAASTLDIQLIIVTGTNKKLKTQLDKLVKDAPKKVVLLGYSENIHQLMAITDIIITKPGGLTVSEAMIKHLPMILISPIPGQEEKNAQYLTNMGIAAKVSGASDCTTVVAQLLENPLRLRHMRRMARLKARPNACKDITMLMDRMKK
ncbi:MAG: MGDG synthase family glycosyltransferase [Mahellales bacterium]|jgi:processive 1,2-diacylglycerol beta-glucosyltransferase